MSIRNAAGAKQTKTSVMALMTDVTPDENKVYRFDGTANLYRARHFDGAATFEDGLDLRFVPGQSYRLNAIDDEYPAPTITAIAPETGAAAGGDAVTITGTNLGQTTGGTIGAVAMTSYVVVSDTEVTAVSPAKAAGTHDVVLTDSGGADATLSAAFTTA